MRIYPSLILTESCWLLLNHCRVLSLTVVIETFYLVETHMYYLTEVIIWQKMSVVLCIDLILITRRIRNWKRTGGLRETDRERDSHMGCG